MARRMVATTLVLAIVVGALGCSITRPSTVPKSEYVPVKNERILEVDLVAGGTVKFDAKGGFYINDSRVIHGVSNSGAEVEISIDDVKSIRVERRSDNLSLTATFLGLALLSVTVMYVLGMHAQWFSN